jgi:4-hydroxythreonine-4-phosphate dehydrogenase
MAERGPAERKPLPRKPDADHPRPTVALTMGDPAGIGPEIVVRALADPGVAAAARCLVFGDARVLERAASLLGAAPGWRVTRPPKARGRDGGGVAVVDLANAEPAAYEGGRVSALCGRASWEYVQAASRAALAGEVDAVATAPINKEAVAAAGVPHIGHTEMLAALTGVDQPLTMFESQGLRVFFLSRHVSLRAACDLVTRPRIVDCLQRCSAALSRLGVRGAIAVAGLNPHCGEHGLFGAEEGREIEPAVAAARAMGLAVEGPVSADSVFHLARTGRYAAVLSLYHDQGHIACKTLDFERTVSLTLGLPFLRTSVDHGTAFDIAWKGKAGAVSMVEAILAAARYAKAFRAGIPGGTPPDPMPPGPTPPGGPTR